MDEDALGLSEDSLLDEENEPYKSTIYDHVTGSFYCTLLRMYQMLHQHVYIGVMYASNAEPPQLLASHRVPFPLRFIVVQSNPKHIVFM
jgi:hypothetical protein